MDLVEKFLKKGVLISPGIKNKIKIEDIEDIFKNLRKNQVVVTDDFYCELKGKGVNVLYENKKGNDVKKVTDFVDFYNKRFDFLRNIIIEKVNKEKMTSINKLTYGESIIIGMIRKIKENGFVLEDSTGSIFCLSDEKVLEDEVVGVEGVFEKTRFKEDKIFYPDIPLNNKTNMSKEDCKILFTKELTSRDSQKHSHIPYLFTFDCVDDIDLNNRWLVGDREKIKKGKRTMGLSMPFLVEVEGVKVFVLEIEMDEISKKIGLDNEQKILISLLKRRHLLPFVYNEGDPYMLRDIPDVIFLKGGKESFFLNYKGVSVVSVSGPESFVVNLKTREHERYVPE